MKINIYRRNECGRAGGLCVVIDVLRAFTTAAYAFHAGAKEIVLVSTIEEAMGLFQGNPSLVLMGEIEGRKIEGFHYGNSPAEIKDADLRGRILVQRTSAGTQGVVGCGHAAEMLIASFVVAEATLREIQRRAPSEVSFVVTGECDGDEDLALAEYLQERLLRENVSVAPFLERVRVSREGKELGDLHLLHFPREDLDLAVSVDRFPFAMEVKKRRGMLVAQKIFSR